ncbi:MAG: amidohydrolase [candidate division Zixibacteria bacterium]|nr:amidohydrolase [candidate division Zixibacteria bacterium]
MKAKYLICNTRIYTQAEGLVANSMAVGNNRIAAVGNNLDHDPDFWSYSKIDLKGKAVIPGLVDAHTHFHSFALSLGQLKIDGVDSFDKCLARIKRFAADLGKNEWVIGQGYSLDGMNMKAEPDRYLLDRVTGGRPAVIYSKDTHTVWINSRALEVAGITADTPDPEGGWIVHSEDGSPSGILKEKAAWMISQVIPRPTKGAVDKFFGRALDYAHRKGVTGVHSVDSPEAFVYFSDRAEKDKLGLRIDYYMTAEKLPELLKNRVYYGTGTEFFRLAGIKLFADGALSSRSALCFHKYLGSKDNYGVEVTSTEKMKKLIREASRLGLPCAIHAIGDKGACNVLDALEGAPPLDFGARHRIEHLQLLRRKDIPRVKRLRVVASMQPSHCPSDIEKIRRHWGRRGANAFVFRTLIDSGVDLAFGSDCPIEPLDPLAGIAAAVRRALPGSRDVFYPDQRITPAEALYRFTVGPAIATGQQHRRGYLLPGYVADFVVLSDDLTKTAPGRIYDIEVLATFLDGRVKYCHSALNL